MRLSRVCIIQARLPQMIDFAVSLKQMFLSFSDPPSLEGMEAEQKSKKTRRVFGTQPKKPGPGLMVQTPRADTGDSGFRRYLCTTLFNIDS